MGLGELVRESDERRTMMTVAVHERWSGQAARAAALREFIEGAQGMGGVRFMRRCDIARWWLDSPRTVGVGLIGAGAVAEHHLGVLGTLPDVEISAACDIHEGARCRCAAAHWSASASATGGRCSTRGGWMRCSCARRRTTPRRRSPRSSAACPSTSRSRSRARSPTAEAIAAAWRASGVRVRRRLPVAHRSMCSRELRALLRGLQPGLLVSRSFGPTEGARARPRAGDAGWFADPRASGGILFELASHDIDLQIALAGPVESVQATAGQRPARARRPAAERPRRRRRGAPALRERRHRRRHVAWTAEQRPPLYALDVHAADAALQLDARPRLRAARPCRRRRGRRHGRRRPRASRRSRGFLDAGPQRRSGRRALQPGRRARHAAPPWSHASGRSRAASASPST